MNVVWRGAFGNAELDALHAHAFGTRASRDWPALAERHSLGWAVARDGETLVGWANVPWDGRAHAWLQDVMVAPTHRRRGVGTALVAAVRDAAGEEGCEWLHVDFEERLAGFYAACGFTTTAAGLLRLR